MYLYGGELYNCSTLKENVVSVAKLAGEPFFFCSSDGAGRLIYLEGAMAIVHRHLPLGCTVQLKQHKCPCCAASLHGTSHALSCQLVKDTCL